MTERRQPDACKMLRFCGFEIRVGERATYHHDGTITYTYEPRMLRKSKVASRYHVYLVVGQGGTRQNGRYTASASEAVDPSMVFTDPDVAHYAAIVATWRWVEDSKGSKAHPIK